MTRAVGWAENLWMGTITVYAPDGRSMEIPDTPRQRRRAKGKGYPLTEPPADISPAPQAPVADVQDLEDDDLGYEE